MSFMHLLEVLKFIQIEVLTTFFVDELKFASILQVVLKQNRVNHTESLNVSIIILVIQLVVSTDWHLV